MATTEEAKVALVVDARQAKRGADEFERAMKAVTAANEAAVRATERVENAAASQSRAFTRLRSQLDPTFAAQQRLERGTRTLNAALERGNIDAAEHARLVGLLEARYRTAGTAVDTVGAQMAAGAGTSRGLGMAIQQAGFQVGDFAVQVASGQSAMRAFIQQGSQLLGFFGPWGAVIGAGMAVVGALATSLLDFGDAANSAERTAEALDRTIADSADNVAELRSKYGQLTEQMRELERVSIAAAMRRIAEEQREIRSAVTDTLQPLEHQLRLREAIRQLNEATSLSPDETIPDIVPPEAVDAFARFVQGGDVATLVTELARVAEAGGQASERLREMAEDLIDEARRSAELSDETRRLAASLRVLEGTATAADLAILNLGERADRTSRLQKEQLEISIRLAESQRREEEAAAKRGRDIIEGMRKRREALEQEAEIAQRRLELAGADERTRTIELRLLQEINKERAAGTPLLEDEIAQRRELIATIVDAEAEFDRIAKQSDEIKNGFEDAGDAIATAFEDAIVKGEGVGAMLRGLEQDLIRIATRVAITNPLERALTGFIGGIDFGSFFGGGGAPAPTGGTPLPGQTPAMPFHSGGVVGSTPVTPRVVPASLFANAPRFHNGGLVADEVPVIAKRGEVIGWPDQMRRAFGGANVTVQIIDQRSSGGDIRTRETRGPNGERMIQAFVLDAVDQGLASGRFDRTLGRTFGVTRRGATR